MDVNAATLDSLTILTWNANGLTRHKTELEILLNDNRIDIALISETHLLPHYRINFLNYTVYRTDHPDNTAQGGTAIIIKSSLNHYIHSRYSFDYLQSTAVSIVCSSTKLTLASVYCPPRFRINYQMFNDFFSSLGPRFIAGGDFNSKHPLWGSRLITPRGRTLHMVIQNNNLSTLSPPTPTYWPTDPHRIPDLLDFFICRGVTSLSHEVVSLLDLSSDHSPVLLTLGISKSFLPSRPTLTPGATNWDLFKEIVNTRLNLRIPLKNGTDIENAIDSFNTILQEAAWASSTPRTSIHHGPSYPLYIRRLIQEKRRWRGRWQRYRLPNDKRKYNTLNNDLKKAIRDYNQERFTFYAGNLNETDGSLWKATRRLLRHSCTKSPLRYTDGTWARSDSERTELLARHFSSVFQPNDVGNDEQDRNVCEYLLSPLQLSPPPKYFSPGQVHQIIKQLPKKKAPGYDLISSEILNQLPRKAIVFLTCLYNSILRTTSYPIQWKLSVIIVIPKPNKPLENPESYRPISLLPLCSKVFEKLLFKRIFSILEDSGCIPYHQFGFRPAHSTVHQLHRVVDYIASGFERKHYVNGVFLDISQAFDKVWHQGLLFKLKQKLPDTYYLILKSFLSDRFFSIRENNTFSPISPIKAGVPQGSVLSPLLYIFYTADMPTIPQTLTATFADDTAILCSSYSPLHASLTVQHHLNQLSVWLNTWKIKVNPFKSNNVIFSLRLGTSPGVLLGNSAIPQSNTVKYLGVTLDKRLTWRDHILSRRQTITTRTKLLYGLIGRKSPLCLTKKLNIYKLLLKPIWTYACQIFGSTKRSNLQRLQSTQSKILRIITDAPWYVRNDTLHNDLKIPYILDAIKSYYERFHRKTGRHKNQLIRNLNSRHLPNNPPRRLKRSWNRDLLQN